MKLLQLIVSAVSTLVTVGASDDGWPRQPFESPYFDTTTPTNVTALQGKTAYLHCKVKRLNNKTVSWIRTGDLHIISVGTITYTNDARFSVARDAARNDWTLMVKFAQPSDSGQYECQISTQPSISYPVQLRVVVPKAQILGGPDMFISSGSLLNLTCMVTNSPQPPEFVFWYHGDKVISYDSARGGVSVVTHKGAVTVSHLLVTEAQPSDSGVYSCRPTNAEACSTVVHVLSGEKPAAMHTSSGRRAPTTGLKLLSLLLLTLTLRTLLST